MARQSARLCAIGVGDPDARSDRPRGTVRIWRGDVCPIITNRLREVSEELGPAAADVAIVAITVDPETDTVERSRQYSDAMGMEGKWHFLTGSRAQLNPIWKAYYVAPLSEALSQELTAASDLATTDSRFAGAHTAPVYLIDKQGRKTSLHTGGDLSVQDLLHDVRLLLKAGG